MAELLNRSTYEVTIAKALARFLSDQRKSLFAIVVRNDPIPASFWATFQSELSNLLQPYLSALHLQSSLEHFVDAVQSLPAGAFDVAVGGADTSIATAGAEARLQSEALQWGNQRAADVSARLARNVQDEITAKQTDWQAIRSAGDPIPDSRIRSDLVDSLGPNRAANVTTTEVTNASATGGEAGMRTAGQEFPDTDSGPDEFDLWINNPHLSRTGPCPICEPLHKTPRSVWSEQFSDGPPAHPNCILPGTLVRTGGQRLQAGFKFRFDGPAVEITFASGQKLAVTGNHPVCTRRGMVPANEIDNGDYCVHAFGCRNPEHTDEPVVIDEIVNASRVSLDLLGVESAGVIRINSSPEAFDGDGRFSNSKVDIVLFDCHLRDRFNVAFFQHLVKLHFVRRHASDSIESECFICGCSLPLFANRMLSSTSGFVSGFGLLSSGFSGKIPHLHGSQFGSASQLDSMLNESKSNYVARDSDVLADCQNRLSVPVAFDQVVKVRKFNFRGHVYDLQLSPGHRIIANDHVVSNCVCEIDYANGPGPGKLRGASVLPNGEKVVDLFRRAEGITGPLL